MTLLIITNLLYAIGYPLSQIALVSSEPLFLIAIRMLLSGAILIGYHVIKKKTFRLPAKSLWPICLSGILTAYLSNALSYWGLASVTATRAALIDNMSPLMSAFLEWMIFKDQFSALEWIGIVIATLGTMPAMASPLAQSELLHNMWWNLSWGDLVIIMSNLAGVYGFICIRKIASDKDYEPIFANGISMFVGGSCALVHSLFTEHWTPVPAQDYISVAAHVIIMMIIYNFAVDNLYNYLAREYTVTTLMLSGFMVPIFTAAIDWFFYGFTVSPVFWVSSCIICIGLFCSARKKYYQPAPSNSL
jgi:drug/metabolite transporter (DMT)-like permease